MHCADAIAAISIAAVAPGEGGHLAIHDGEPGASNVCAQGLPVDLGADVLPVRRVWVSAALDQPAQLLRLLNRLAAKHGGS
jgi:hypothetical protein